MTLYAEQIELFFRGISRRKNPSQIAIVNEVIKKSKRNKEYEQDLVGKGEKTVTQIIEKYGHMTIKELSEKANISQASALTLSYKPFKEGCYRAKRKWKNKIFCS